MKSYVITHLSDLHLTSDENGKRFEPKISGQLTGMNAAFRRILSSERVQRSDLVLITGDVTDQGDIAGWTRFHEILKQTKIESKALVVLGNHDVCGLSTRLGWPAKLSKSDLERACKGLILTGQPHKYPWAKVVDPRVVIFGLDTNNSGNLSPLDNAVGKLGQRQLQSFAELLAKYRKIPVKLVALHHSPNIPQTATALKRGQAPLSLIFRWTHQIPQEERRAFRALCVASKVRLVLHGHLHQAEDRRVNGLRIIGAPASTEPVDRKSNPRKYKYFEYSVAGKSHRVGVELVTV